MPEIDFSPSSEGIDPFGNFFARGFSDDLYPGEYLEIEGENMVYIFNKTNSRVFFHVTPGFPVDQLRITSPSNVSVNAYWATDDIFVYEII